MALIIEMQIVQLPKDQKTVTENSHNFGKYSDTWDQEKQNGLYLRESIFES